MNPTVTVIPSGQLDTQITKEVVVGMSIAQVIASFGNELGYDRSMVASINGVSQVNHAAVLNHGDSLVFRPSAKERGI